MSTETSAITWKDATSYSRDQPRVQNAWETRIGPVRIVVVNAHIYWPGQWACSVWPITNEARGLPERIALDDLPGAQAAALKMAEEILKPYAEAYSVIAEERMR